MAQTQERNKDQMVACHPLVLRVHRWFRQRAVVVVVPEDLLVLSVTAHSVALVVAVDFIVQESVSVALELPVKGTQVAIVLVRTPLTVQAVVAALVQQAATGQATTGATVVLALLIPLLVVQLLTQAAAAAVVDKTLELTVPVVQVVVVMLAQGQQHLAMDKTARTDLAVVVVVPMVKFPDWTIAKAATVATES